jgi:hypothetical protein
MVEYFVAKIEWRHNSYSANVEIDVKCVKQLLTFVDSPIEVAEQKTLFYVSLCCNCLNCCQNICNYQLSSKNAFVCWALDALNVFQRKLLGIPTNLLPTLGRTLKKDFSFGSEGCDVEDDQ